MTKRPYGNFLIDDKLSILNSSIFHYDLYSGLKSLISYKLLIKPVLILYTKLRFKLSKGNYKTNGFDALMMWTTILVSFILLPIITIELAIHTLYLLLAIFFDRLIFSRKSFYDRYIDLNSSLNYLQKNIIFQITFWALKFKPDPMSKFIHYALLSIMVIFVLTVSFCFFSFLVTSYDKCEHHGLILKDFHVIHFWGNYYYSDKVTKTLIHSYDYIVKLIRNDKEYFDKLFNLFVKNVNSSFGIEKNLELLKLRLLDYARNDNLFSEFKNGLVIKTEIICNLNNDKKLDKIIQKIGIDKSRKYLNDLQEYVENNLEDYCYLYNYLFMKLRIKLL